MKKLTIGLIGLAMMASVASAPAFAGGYDLALNNVDNSQMKKTSVDKPVCVKDSFSSKPITCPPGMHVEIRTFTTTTTECGGGGLIGWIGGLFGGGGGYCRT